MKSTSIFGGVQVFNIIIAIVRSKIVAVLLGPSGVGIISLLTTTIGLIAGVTNFGLGTVAVKNIAIADTSEDKHQIARTIHIFRRLVWITGSLGFVLTLILSPLLSRMAFGNKTYTIAFILLSITLLFAQINAGQNAVLQGMRKIQYMAKASMLGAVAGLIISIPLYFFFKEKGIVPAMIITSIITLILSWYYAKKIKIPKAIVEKTVFRNESREMLSMGFFISMSGLIGIGSAYIVRIFISKSGGIVDVGLFSAGFTIVNTYVGMVFTAMGTDYYPRLSSLAHDNEKRNESINQQAEIAVLILAPILIIFIVFIKWAIILLYSNEFLGVVTMIHWAALGVFFKAISWSIGYLFLAKSDSKLFFWNELLANSYMLAFNIAGYYYAGLSGLGISFLATYLMYFLQVYIVTNRKYGFVINKELVRLFLIQFSIAVICFVVILFFKSVAAYIVGIILILISGLYSWQKLNEKIGIKQLISNWLIDKL